MPPKDRRQLSNPARTTARGVYKVIASFAEGNDELFAETIRALMDSPGVVRALGIPGTSHLDTDAVSSMLASARSTFTGRLSTTGTRHAGEREQAQSVAAALYSSDVSRDRALSLAGIPRKTWEGGAELAAALPAASNQELSPTSWVPSSL